MYGKYTQLNSISNIISSICRNWNWKIQCLLTNL